jgi:hypothetical protein
MLKGANLKKLIVSAAATVLALAFAGSALAAYVPHLVVSQAGTKTTIHVTIAKEDDATSRIVIYAPAAAPATLTQAVGTPIGTVTAQVNAKAISPDAILPLTGIVQVADGSSAQLATAAMQCTGTATHAATWLLVLTAAGQTIPVPAWVDATTGAEAAFGTGKLTVCLGSPDIGAACAPTFCAKLLDVNFTVDGIFGPSSAPIAIWPSVFTPYVPGTATANPAGTVLALGVESQPTLTLAAKVAKGGKTTITGRISAAGIGAPGVTVTIQDGARKLTSKKTGASGSFSAVVKLKKGTHSLRARAAATDTDVTAQGCAAAPAGAPTCVSATAAGVALASKTLKVKVK